MIYVGIVNHEEELSLLLRRVLAETMSRLGKSMGCFSYENSYTFLNEWRRGQRHFDILLMNVSLLEEGTLEAARQVKEAFPDTEIVLLAKNDNLALQAFQLGVRHYLLLPTTEAAVKEAVLRCVRGMEGNWQRKILVKSGTTWQLVPLAELEAVVSDDHHQILCLNGGRELEVRLKMSEIQEGLAGRSPFHFLSPGRGTLVNAEMVDSFDASEVHMKSGRILSVSKRRYGEFKKEMEALMAD